MVCTNPDIVRIGIDVEDFKELFKRGFSYLPEYSASTTYNAGDVVYYSSSSKFYSCKIDGTIDQLPTNTTYWVVVNGLKIQDYVLDEDIENAFDEACMKFNSSLFYNDEEIKLGFLYLSAHFLISDLDAANGNGTGTIGLANSRSVGNVSESYAIPEWMLKSPFSFYSTTYYGRKYLNMVYSRSRGNMSTVWSGTNA